MNVSNATTVQLLSTAATRLRAAVDRSLTGDRVRQLYRTARTVASASRLADGARWSEQAVRASWLFGWLTEGPEPDVVVIDLRETVVVGPVISVLDSFLMVTEKGSDRALTVELSEALRERLRARPIQIVSVASLAAVVGAVGVFALLGALTVRTLGFALVSAGLALAGTRVTASWEDLTDSRLFEGLVALLEPPEPPEPPEKR